MQNADLKDDGCGDTAVFRIMCSAFSICLNIRILRMGVKTMRIQVSLTVEAGKRLIAKAIASLPQVRSAIKEHQLIIKGGTTTSAFSEELATVGLPLKISGRIERLGTGSCPVASDAPHNIIIRGGEEVITLDTALWLSSDMKFSKGDVCVIGANIVDKDGRAAMMAGSRLGGDLHFFAGLPAEGVEMIIAAGLEKYSPCSLDDVLEAASRSGVDMSMGMAVGLVEIPGTVVDERRACEILGASHAVVIGRGGVCGAEGGCTLVLDFESEAAGSEFFDMAHSLTEFRTPAGDPATIRGCLETHCGPTAAGHMSCWYRGNR